MATVRRDDRRAARCPDCDARTAHEVRIEGQVECEDDDAQAANDSREPDRVATCRRRGRGPAKRTNVA